MKKTFYFLLLFFFISCNTNKEDILNSKSDSISYVDSNEELVVSEISKQIGNLHNTSIEEFIEYVYSNEIDVYKLNKSQIDSVIIEFTNKYLICVYVEYNISLLFAITTLLTLDVSLILLTISYFFFGCLSV